MQPVDLAHLASQTGGDDALQADVLRLFAARSLADLARLKAATPAARPAIAHLLVGSARAIGAEKVAVAARAVEAGAGSVALLEQAIDDACAFIRRHLGA